MKGKWGEQLEEEDGGEMPRGRGSPGETRGADRERGLRADVGAAEGEALQAEGVVLRRGVTGASGGTEGCFGMTDQRD